MDGMQKQFKMHAETNALARSTGNVNGEVLRRMAQLEDVVRRDGRALQSVEQQLRVGLSQGAINGRHNAGGGGGDAGSGGSAAAAARSAAQATQVAAEAQDMLAELRATLRAKEAEDAQLQAQSKKQMQVLAVELQRASSDVNTLTVQLARTQDRLEQVAASSSPSGAGRNEPPAAQGGGDAVISQMAALNRHVNKQLAGMGEDIDMRLKVLEGRDAEAGSSAGPSELAAQVDDLSQALATLQTELQHERDSRKDAEASHMSVMVELRKALNEEKQHVGAKLGEVVSDLGRNLVEVREHGLERVNSARNTLDKQQRVVYRGLVSLRQPRCGTHARFVLILCRIVLKRNPRRSPPSRRASPNLKPSCGRRAPRARRRPSRRRKPQPACCSVCLPSSKRSQLRAQRLCRDWTARCKLSRRRVPSRCSSLQPSLLAIATCWRSWCQQRLMRV